MKVRCLIRNEDFLKNMSENFIEDLVHLNEPIPMRIRSMLIDYIPNFNLRRSNFIGENEEFISRVREERFIARELSSLESGEYHNDLALQFIDNHPEFAQIIKEVKYIDV